MTLEFGLLILESGLLVATVILLIYGIHEGRRRDHLLREVRRSISPRNSIWTRRI